ncbi:rRNA small subunit methyltransferase I [Hyphomicrobium sulfonivorans]|uniref:Ribosomal RNA small subunit methyltransferase I n=1 Tax=Hyphomicrobium sulfonivorans TaxID=121290 RepID=A0A120CUI2_HYPSL|nr:16S rRNA (cytidine(1402)-2'-O)-methyltransferase [Hyphomicrobium sulfonivorans]KWT66235.1 rRNA small subunit methyltransferase I [Hyphomicrobium sulfonivorans]
MAESSTDFSHLMARAGGELARQTAPPLPAGLYAVATPIGNLGDITLRALAVLARADIILCEDTRHSRTLLAHFAITAPMRPYHEHNAARERPRVLAELAEGKRIALISDAGTPLISDPGWKLMREAIDAGHRVEALPGASAPLVALTIAGLPTDAFLFAGFLPPKSAARQTRIRELAGVPATLVFFESPTRAPEAMADLAAVLGPRPAALARELTKLHEQVLRGSLDGLAAELAERPVKGECVILVGAPVVTAAIDDDVVAHLQRALADMSLRDASKAVSEALNVPKNRVYELGLQLRQSGGDDGADDAES